MSHPRAHKDSIRFLEVAEDKELSVREKFAFLNSIKRAGGLVLCESSEKEKVENFILEVFDDSENHDLELFKLIKQFFEGDKRVQPDSNARSQDWITSYGLNTKNGADFGEFFDFEPMMKMLMKLYISEADLAHVQFLLRAGVEPEPDWVVDPKIKTESAKSVTDILELRGLLLLYNYKSFPVLLPQIDEKLKLMRADANFVFELFADQPKIRALICPTIAEYKDEKGPGHARESISSVAERNAPGENPADSKRVNGSSTTMILQQARNIHSKSSKAASELVALPASENVSVIQHRSVPASTSQLQRQSHSERMADQSCSRGYRA